MNSILMRTIVLTAEYRAVTTKAREVASVEVSVPPTNAGPVSFLGDDGAEVIWAQGEYHGFKRINLAELRVKGTPGDIVTLVGGTW